MTRIVSHNIYKPIHFLTSLAYKTYKNALSIAILWNSAYTKGI